LVRPILVDGENGIIAGHGSTQAAIESGMTDISTLRVDHLSLAQLRAYVIPDNRLAENAGWDRELLSIELKALSESTRIAARNVGVVADVFGVE
jgi:ParB-like chromosome segregation protein Spo0J